MLTRREFGKLALAVPAAAAASSARDASRSSARFAQAKPNSLIDGVQIGTITYSYRSMPDQSAEATLKYIVDSGISADRADGRSGRELRRRADAAGRGGGGGRGRWTAVAVAAAVAAAQPLAPMRLPMTGSWNGQPCAVPAPAGGGRRRRRAAADAAAARRRPSSRRRSRSRPTSSRRGGRASRWTRSRSCARCTTTPA